MAPRKIQSQNGGTEKSAENIDVEGNTDGQEQENKETQGDDWHEENGLIVVEDDTKPLLPAASKRGRPRKTRWDVKPKEILKAKQQEKVEHHLQNNAFETMMPTKDVTTQTEKKPVEVKQSVAEQIKIAADNLNTKFESMENKWMLARPKYGEFNHKCDQCRDENFRMGNKRFRLHPYFKFDHNNALPAGEVRWVKFETFCNDCAFCNIEITERLMKLAAKKKSWAIRFDSTGPRRGPYPYNKKF